jgi:hypothetical protein
MPEDLLSESSDDERQVINRVEVIGSKGKKKLVTRERYLRSDLGCRSILCQKCQSALPPLLSSSSATLPYIIPDSLTIIHFLELLVGNLRNISNALVTKF